MAIATSSGGIAGLVDARGMPAVITLTDGRMFYSIDAIEITSYVPGPGIVITSHADTYHQNPKDVRRTRRTATAFVPFESILSMEWVEQDETLLTMEEYRAEIGYEDIPF